MGKEEFEVERIVKKRIMQNGQIKYYVKWKGYSEDENTWEPEKNLTNAANLLAEFNAKQSKKLENQTPDPNKSLRKAKKETSTEDDSEKKTKNKMEYTVPAESGFDKGFVPEKIVGATDTGGSIKFLVKWKDMSNVELITNERARKHCPQLVIKFYEQNIEWN